MDVTGIGMVQGTTTISTRAAAALAEGHRGEGAEYKTVWWLMTCRS